MDATDLRTCEYCYHTWPFTGPSPEGTFAGHWCPRRDRAEAADAERARVMRDGFLTDFDGPHDFQP